MVIRRACREGGRTYLGRSPACPGDRTERAASFVTATEKSADGIVGGTSFAEGLNTGKTLEVEISSGPCGRRPRSLAFGAAGMGEARTALLEGPKPARGHLPSEPLARTQTKPSVLNPVNRRIRTRMSGGVGGEESRGSPLSRLVMRKQ